MNNQANSKLKLFINLLNGIFELDKSDLDFGIYRVMNIRKAEIEKFLKEDLKEKVRETLSPFVKDTSEIERTIAEIERDCNRYQIDINTSVRADEYNMLKKQLKEGVDITALETDVYSALYTFFSRYYVEGDFISRRLYKEQDKLYAIPYNGEEVKLYWVNYDQYYIKTTENFKDYTFIADDYTIHFRLIDATTEQDNNKESDESKRVFMLYTENDNNPGIKTFEYNEEKKELIIRFVFDVPEDKKKNYAQENYTVISAKIISDYKQLMIPLLRNISSEPKKPKTLIQKHLESYVAKNTFDYFIHKDLKGFLTRELDFYIKNEIIHLDDIDTVNEQRVETYLAKVKAIKRVGKIIIDFLAQIEEFQKKLWLKKKFIIETNWCITLDKINESFYPEIIKNKEQIKEWINLYHIDEIEGNLTDIAFTDPLTMEFLKQNKNLIIDTKNFSTDFRDRLIASFDNLDEQTDGLMIYSENFQALNLLQEKYRGKINCIYADPPYNSKSSEILYKNSFKHSSWLSFMADRMILAAQLKNKKAALITAIDENEASNLLQLYNSLFPSWEKSCISIVHNPAGVQGDNFSYSHEYAVFGFEKYKHIIGKTQRDQQSEEAFRDWGGTCARSLAQNCFYPIYIKDNKIIGFGDVCDDDFHPGSSNIHRNGIIEVYPIGDDGQERKWVFARDSVEKIKNNLRVKEKNGVYSISRIKTQTSYKTVWNDKKYYANIYGSKLLNNIMGNKKFDFPKSLYTVQECLYAVNSFRDENAIALDYFAGSGTTGHAVININREFGGNRKYILIEMGEYFNSVTKPRMKKIIYSADWKDGKPINRNTGVSHIMKYIRLESYEDTLTNIQLKDSDVQMSTLFGDDYLINYMLDLESKDSILNLDSFKMPFNYKLKITEKNETKEKNIDLSETFNYLIGLNTIHQSEITYYRSKPSENPIYEGAVTLIKDIDGDYAFRKIDGILPDGRHVLIIWRTITDDLIVSNAALDAYYKEYCTNKDDNKYDIIYVNGDNNLENLRTDDDNWKINLIELEFKKRMFENI